MDFLKSEQVGNANRNTHPFERLISMGSGLLDAISVPLTGYAKHKKIIQITSSTIIEKLC